MNRNPFIVGDWIKRDEDFIGRTDLIRKYLAFDKQHYWLIGARRMGKTSLLRYLQRQFRKQEKCLPLFWDVSGANSGYDLKLSFLDCLEAGESDFDRNEIELDIAALEDESLLNILRRLSRECAKNSVRVYLLIDESEGLFTVAAQEPHFFNRFKAFILNNNIFYMIMASNHGLIPGSTLDTTHFMAPFLQAFLPPDFLPPWTQDEALALISRLKIDSETAERLIEYTGCLPFLVQILCFYFFDENDFDAAIKRIENESILDLFFRDDLQYFNQTDCNILAAVERNEPLTHAQIQQLTGSELLQSKQYLFHLTRLGFLTEKQPGEYYLSNHFLRTWIRQNLSDFQQFESVTRYPNSFKCRLWLQFKNDTLFISLLINDEIIRKIEAGLSINPDQYCISSNADFASMKDIGKRVFHSLFSEHQVNTIYRDFIAKDKHGEIIISTENDKFSNIPFELMHNGEDFLVLRHPFFRYGQQKVPELKNDSLTLQQPLKILLIASNTPPDIPFVDNEILLLKQQLQKIGREHHIEIESMSLASNDSDYYTVVNRLNSGEYHFVHYAGHCAGTQYSPNSKLYLWETSVKTGKVRALDAGEFAQLLNDGVSFVYLNACNSASPADAVYQNISGFAEAARKSGTRVFLGNGSKIDDQASAKFAMDFYRNLFCAHFNFSEALYQTRVQWAQKTQYQQSGYLFWLAPVLWQDL